MPGNRYINNKTLRFSQNFLTSSVLIKRIISISGIGKNDSVIEIGAGKGHITAGLTAKCKNVTAIETDGNLFSKLKQKFSGTDNPKLINADFLKWKLPETSYKIFANIPFNRTAEIIKKLTSGVNPPEEAWLVVEKGAAIRFCGGKSQSFSSLSLKPFYDLEIKYYFKKEDFHPAPSVDCVLLRISKKTAPDIPPRQFSEYNGFLSVCMRDKNGINNFLTKKQVSAALRECARENDIRSGDTLYVQWLCLFRRWRKYGDRGVF